MNQHGINKEEVEETLNNGWQADDVKPGIYGKTFVIPYNKEWEEKYFEEKEVRVYYKVVNNEIVLLTVKARYGRNFSRGEKRNED
jgi:hypothetical protein